MNPGGFITVYLFISSSVRLPIYSFLYLFQGHVIMRLSPPRNVAFPATVKKKLLSASVFIFFICVICVILFTSDSTVLVWRGPGHCDHHTLLPSSRVSTTITIFYGQLRLLTQGELTDPSLDTLFTATTTIC